MILHSGEKMRPDELYDSILRYCSGEIKLADLPSINEISATIRSPEFQEILKRDPRFDIQLFVLMLEVEGVDTRSF